MLYTSKATRFRNFHLLGRRRCSTRFRGFHLRLMVTLISSQIGCQNFKFDTCIDDKFLEASKSMVLAFSLLPFNFFSSLHICCYYQNHHIDTISLLNLLRWNVAFRFWLQFRSIWWGWNLDKRTWLYKLACMCHYFIPCMFGKVNEYIKWY